MTPIANADIVKAVASALEAGKAKERKFKQSVDLAITLKNVDLSVPKNRIDEDIVLPKGRGKAASVAIFAQGEGAVKARKVADLVIQPDEFESLVKDKRKFKKTATNTTYFLAEAPLMAQIGKSLGVVLGPRGKMPRPIPPGSDPAGPVNNLRNTVKVRSKDRITFHAPVGAEGMSAEDIAENVELVLKRVEAKLEHGRLNLSSVYVKTTMGSPVRLV